MAHLDSKELMIGDYLMAHGMNYRVIQIDGIVRDLMECKGFTEKQLLLFESCFAGGCETVIIFNKECEMADLDLGVAAGMTKDEIIERLSRYASDKTTKLLKGEQI